MDTRKHSRLVAAAVAVALAGTATAARAQEVVAEAEGNVALEELVVTARKREESLIDVPISMTAVTGEAMALANRRSVTDIATSVPGLNINTDSIGRAFISIRGIGTALQAGVQPGVGLFQDGIYVPYTSFANNPTLDIARIEVLRGPQGTLYGKNTLGGAINVITREPSDVFEGSVYATGSSEDESMEGGGRISGPLGDKFKARLAASTRNSNGFFEHDLIEGDVAPIDSTQVNGTLQFDATEDLTLALNGYWQEIEGGGAYSAVNDEKDYRSNVQINVLNRTEFRYEGVNAKADFALPSANTNMTFIAAYDSRDTDGVSDGDFLPFDVVRSSADGRDKTTSVEMRFDTQWNDGFSTLVGVFASNEDVEAITGQRVVPSGVVATTFSESDADTWSVFANALWRVQPDLELALGLRYDDESRTRDSFTTLSVLPTVVIIDPQQRIDDSQVQPRLSLTKFLRDDFTVYGSVAKGYRGGGFNAASVPPEFSTYDGDTVWTYELGSKGSFNDGLTYVSAAIYYNDYEDFIGQNALALGPGGGLVSIDLNLGDVESYGLETEASHQVSDNWRLSGSLTLMHARITDQSGWLEVVGTPLPSDRLLFQPDWTANIDSDLKIPLGESELVWNLNLYGKGSRPGSTFDPVEASILEEYYLVNTSLAWNRGPIQVTVFATNLTDEEYFESYIDGSLLGTLLGVPQTVGIIGSPQNFGLRISYDF